MTNPAYNDRIREDEFNRAEALDLVEERIKEEFARDLPLYLGECIDMAEHAMAFHFGPGVDRHNVMTQEQAERALLAWLQAREEERHK